MEKDAKVKQGLGGVTLSGEESVATAQVNERPVTAPSNAAADAARRAGELRRAARLMAARYAITGSTEVQ